MKNEKRKTGGFTLIELLVVIAIIGLLSSIVLASLSTARLKARDASAMESMSSMRAEAELGLGTDGKYVVNVCNTTNPGGLGNLRTAVGNQLPAGTKCGQNSSYAGPDRPTTWGVSVTLLSAGGQAYCVDSTGYGGIVGTSDVIVNGENSPDTSCY